MTKERPDINDTLRVEGPDAVRARHDRARRFNDGDSARQERAIPPLILPPPSEPMQVARSSCSAAASIAIRLMP